MLNLKRISIYIISVYLITFCWVGAEYILDGAVHSSKVDGGITFILGFYVTKDIMCYTNSGEKIRKL